MITSYLTQGSVGSLDSGADIVPVRHSDHVVFVPPTSRKGRQVACPVEWQIHWEGDDSGGGGGFDALAVQDTRGRRWETTREGWVALASGERWTLT